MWPIFMYLYIFAYDNLFDNDCIYIYVNDYMDTPIVFNLFNFTLPSFLFTVAKDDFKKSYTNNPVNLFTLSDRCDSPQPRYKKHSKFREADTKYQYLSYNQCLPGCFVVGKNVTKAETYYYDDNNKHKINETITDDIECRAFWPRKPLKKTNKQKLIHVPHTRTHTTTSENSVGSGKKYCISDHISNILSKCALYNIENVYFMR